MNIYNLVTNLYCKLIVNHLNHLTLDKHKKDVIEMIMIQ